MFWILAVIRVHSNILNYILHHYRILIFSSSKIIYQDERRIKISGWIWRLLFTIHWKLIFPSCTSGVLITFSCGSTLIGLLKSKLCLLSSCNELLHGILFSVYFNHLVAHKRHLKSCVSITLYLIFYLFCIRLPTL